MRVALLVDPLTLRTKGGSHAPQLAQELLGRGHVVRGFGAPPGTIPHSREAVGEADGEARVSARLAGFRADVLVSYDALSPAAWLGARTARKQRSALVLVEGAVPASAVPWPQRVLQSIGEAFWGRYVRETARRVVALDPVARDKALREGFSSQRVSILPEGVDTTTFRPGLTSSLAASRRIRGRILLYAGPLELRRGVETLLLAFGRTVGQREDWTLVLAGDGSAGPRLRAVADRIGIGARVHYMPRPRVEELPGLMGASTLFAIPALDDAPRGRQVVRAMACGLPVLASDLPRLRYFVDDGLTGLVAPPGDLAAWTALLSRAATAPEARRRWGERARSVAVERFAWPGIATAFEAMLTDVAAERAPGAAPAKA